MAVGATTSTISRALAALLRTGSSADASGIGSSAVRWSVLAAAKHAGSGMGGSIRAVCCRAAESEKQTCRPSRPT
jgi:stage V sporulation protein SpoVS